MSSSGSALNQQSPRLPHPSPASRVHAPWHRLAIEPRKQESGRADRHLAADSQTAGRWSESNLNGRSNLHDDEGDDDDDDCGCSGDKKRMHVASRTNRCVAIPTQSRAEQIASIPQSMSTLTGVSSGVLSVHPVRHRIRTPYDLQPADDTSAGLPNDNWSPRLAAVRWTSEWTSDRPGTGRDEGRPMDGRSEKTTCAAYTSMHRTIFAQVGSAY
jgi:hypothetical protein